MRGIAELLAEQRYPDLGIPQKTEIRGKVPNSDVVPVLNFENRKPRRCDTLLTEQRFHNLGNLKKEMDKKKSSQLRCSARAES